MTYPAQIVTVVSVTTVRPTISTFSNAYGGKRN